MTSREQKFQRVLLRIKSDGHKIAGCLVVKLFALHTASFRVIFKVGKKQKGATPEVQRLSNEIHIQDWILVVLSLLQWH